MIKLFFFLFVSQVLVQAVEEKWFEQKLDHSGQYPGTWKQVNLYTIDFLNIRTLLL